MLESSAQLLHRAGLFAAVAVLSALAICLFGLLVDGRAPRRLVGVGGGG